MRSKRRDTRNKTGLKNVDAGLTWGKQTNWQRHMNDSKIKYNIVTSKTQFCTQKKGRKETMTGSEIHKTHEDITAN